jgi:RNA polymerase sigma factor (sigma-70 family)
MLDTNLLKDLYADVLPYILVEIVDKELAKKYLQDAILKLREDHTRKRVSFNSLGEIKAYLVKLCIERLNNEEKEKQLEKRIIESLSAVESDGWAFYYMQMHYFPGISFFICKNGGSEEEAKDIIMDGIEALITNIRSGAYTLRSTAKLKTYFFQICKNKWYDYLAKKSRTRPVSLFADLDFEQFESDYYQDYDEDLLNERQRKVVELFQKSSDKCKQVLGMYYYDELSHEEIASRMGYSGPDSSKNQKSKCLRKMKSVLTASLGTNNQFEELQ